MDGTILVADDDRTIRTVLTQALTRAGCRVHATASLTTLMRWVEEGRGDLVISDVVMPDGNGLEMLPAISKLRPDLPVIIISAQNTIMTAIQAAEADAFDYLPKPFDLPDLMKRAAKGLERESSKPAPALRPTDTQALPLVGRTPLMQELYRVVAKILNTDLPVLLQGESGTGKSLIAKTIHDFSDRRSLPLITVGASELQQAGDAENALGQAKSGTIIFDELADLSPMAQAYLVRALDRLGDNAPRLMATSQQDLVALCEAGKFRDDLYFRLSAVRLLVPPLRRRVDDIALLADHFLNRANPLGDEPQALTADALDIMRQNTWAGNVRQLENTIRRLVATCSERLIEATEVREILGGGDVEMPEMSGNGSQKLAATIKAHLRHYFDLHGEDLPPEGLYGRILREMEVPLIELTLEATGGNQAKCADLLGINRNTLRKKITEMDIRVTRRRKLM